MTLHTGLVIGSAPHAGAAATAAPDAETAPASMTPEAVIEALTFVASGKSPRRTLEAALGMREELTQRLLDELALAPVDVEARADAAPDGSAYYLHELAMYLLAVWREPRAWPLLVDFFVSDNDRAMGFLSIGSEADLPAIMVRCYDGSDLGYFERVIATPQFDALFRQMCLQTYHGLVATGRAPRERYVALLRHMLDAPADAEADDWYDWLGYRAAQLQEPALRPLIERVIERGLTVYADSPLCLIDAKMLERIDSDDQASVVDDILVEHVFDDLPGTVEKWAWFQVADDRYQWPPRLPAREVDRIVDDFATSLRATARPMETFVRASPKRGRNDPCHCGSGKKYKRCCLDNDRSAVG